MYDTLRQLSIEEDKEASFFLMPEPKAEVRPSVQSCGELQFVSKSGYVFCSVFEQYCIVI